MLTRLAVQSTLIVIVVVIVVIVALVRRCIRRRYPKNTKFYSVALITHKHIIFGTWSII